MWLRILNKPAKIHQFETSVAEIGPADIDRDTIFSLAIAWAEKGNSPRTSTLLCSS
jgi:hypothetical protein